MRQDLLKSVLGDKSNLLAQIDEKSQEESRHKNNGQIINAIARCLGLLNSHRVKDSSKLLTGNDDNKGKGQI